MPSVEVTAGSATVKLEAGEASAKELAEIAAGLLERAAALVPAPGVISVGGAAGGGYATPTPRPLNPGDGERLRDLSTGQTY